MRNNHITNLAPVWSGLFCLLTWTTSAQTTWTSPSSWNAMVNDTQLNPSGEDTLLIEGFDEREISLTSNITATGKHDWFYPKEENIRGASDTKAIRLYPGASVEIEFDPAPFDQITSNWMMLLNYAAQNVNKADKFYCTYRTMIYPSELPTTAVKYPDTDNLSLSFSDMKIGGKKMMPYFRVEMLRVYYMLFTVNKTGKSSTNGYYCFDSLMVTIDIPRYTQLKQSGDWNDPASWSHLFPQKRRVALVEGEVSVSTIASCRQLIMHQPDIQITGYGELTADSCTVVYPFASKGKWSFVSFPFDVYRNGIDSRFTLGDASTITTNPNNNILYVMEYDSRKRAEQNGSAPCWRNLSIAEMQGDGPILQKGKGYLLAIDETADTQEVCFSSTMNGPLKYTPEAKIIVDATASQGNDAAHSGWILCGNPYPSQLSLQDIANNADLDGNIYLYDGETYQAYPIGSSYKLAPFSAFFVKAKKSTEMILNQQEHSDETLLRSSEIAFDGVHNQPNVTANEFGMKKWHYRKFDNKIELIDLPSKGQLEVYSITGKRMQSHDLRIGSQMVSLPDGRGIYLLRIEVGDKVEVIKYKR